MSRWDVWNNTAGWWYMYLLQGFQKVRAQLYFSCRLRKTQKNSLLYVTVGYKMLPFTHLLSFLHTSTTSFLHGRLFIVTVTSLRRNNTFGLFLLLFLCNYTVSHSIYVSQNRVLNLSLPYVSCMRYAYTSGRPRASYSLEPRPLVSTSSQQGTANTRSSLQPHSPLHQRAAL